MPFDNVRLPPDIEAGSTGGPSFKTIVLTADSGKEWSNQKWKYPRCLWAINYGVDDAKSYRAIIDFFKARRGRARRFRFKDWTDYTAANSYIGTGDGVITAFQMQKIYDGPVPLVRQITLPIASTVRIYNNDVLMAAGYAVNETTGILTFDVAPNAGEIITADFEFDIRVRFDADALSVSVIWEGAASVSSINIIEVPNADDD